MELNFDIRGNLKPYEKVELDIKNLIEIFVNNFEDSTTRNEIYENYTQYLKDFENEVTPNFIQWIDGSFISNKENPRDIDFVTIIDFDVYQKNEQIIETKFRRYGAKANYKRIDAYTVKNYPENHKRRNITEFDLVYWRGWFTETKKNRAKKKFKKGFIELKFGNKK